MTHLRAVGALSLILVATHPASADPVADAVELMAADVPSETSAALEWADRLHGLVDPLLAG
ncbi:MAG: hypothetical protein AAF492_18845, partial [Verrucomicrobiota bacterium]